MPLRYLVDYGLVLLPLGGVNPVVVIHPGNRPVGGNHGHIDVVDAAELLFLGLGGAGHACELPVHPEVVLDGYCGQGLGLAPYLNVLLGLKGFVQAV